MSVIHHPIEIVLASDNPGKKREFATLLNKLPIRLLSQAELNVSAIEETGLSFVENAILKARHAAHLTGLPALADDSGIVVDALQGAPGIYSARYAGEQANARDNINKLLADLAHVPPEKRTALFHCVLVFMSHAKDPMPLICSGSWSGCILNQPQGSQGFGYDPIFFVPAQQKTAAELTLDLKNQISHRGQAFQALIKQLPDKLCWHSMFNT